MMFHRPDDERLVDDAMRTLAHATPDQSPRPDPSFIWWKAQLLRRIEAERQATAPIAVGEHVHVGAAVLGAAALAVGLWNHLPTLSLSPVAAITLIVSGVVMLSIVAIATWDALRH